MTSVVVTITRWWALERLFECLDNLDTTNIETEYIFLVDTDDSRVIEKVNDYREKTQLS